MKTPISQRDIRKFLKDYDKGVLTRGSHVDTDREFCAVECVWKIRELRKEIPQIDDVFDLSDNPGEAGLPDLRELNDGPWASDKARTEAMVPLLAALSTWDSWSLDQHTTFYDKALTALRKRFKKKFYGGCHGRARRGRDAYHEMFHDITRIAERGTTRVLKDACAILTTAARSARRKKVGLDGSEESLRLIDRNFQ